MAEITRWPGGDAGEQAAASMPAEMTPAPCKHFNLVPCRLCGLGEWCERCDRGLCDGCRMSQETPVDAIIARNEERKRNRRALPAPRYRVEYDSDNDEDGSNWSHWPAWLTSDPRFPSDAIANFTEVEIEDETAEAIAFCCNDRPEDDIAALARMLADEQAAHERTRQELEAARQHADANGHARNVYFTDAQKAEQRLAKALAILDEANAAGNLWPKQQERLAELQATTSDQAQPAAGREA